MHRTGENGDCKKPPVVDEDFCERARLPEQAPGSILQAEQRMLVQGLLQSLTEAETELLIARAVHGQSFARIAKRLGVSNGVARHRYYKLLAKLRKRA